VDAKAAGLEAPAAKVTLHDAKANADLVLLFGKSPEMDKFYAKDQSRTPIFILGTEILDKARQPLLDWRDKSIAQLEQEAIDGIQITRGSDKLSLKKVGTDWQAADGAKLQQDKIFDMLSAVGNERAIQILDSPKSLGAYGLEKPRLEVQFSQAGKETLSLKFGSENKNPAGVYLKTGSNPAVLTVPSGVYDKFNVQMSDIAEPAAAPAPAAK
jgi:hypothetical protein